MKNTRLLIVLETLSRSEWRELEKFVHSPFFNTRPDVIQLFDYLYECLTLHRVIPDKAQIFNKLYKNTAYDDHQVRVVMSLLLKLIEKYFALKPLLEDELGIKIRVAQAYRQRQLNKHFDSTLRDAQQFTDQYPYRHTRYYEHQLALQQEIYERTAARQRTGDVNLRDISNNLDIIYLASKLRFACLALAHQAVYKTDYEFSMLDIILQYISKHDLLNIPVIAIYYYAYLALSQPEEPSYFTHFQQLVHTNAALFPEEERRDLFILAINFCLKSYNAGNPTYLKDLFNLYQTGLQENYLIIQNEISRFTYRNIVTLGLILKEYTWVERFINSYKTFLPTDYQESMYSFCLARLEYSRRNYDKALKLLQKSEYKDLLLNLSAKAVLLKIFYELREFDLLEAHLQAMRTFLTRKKVTASYHKENYRNLLRFTQKLLELEPYNASGKESLKVQVEQEKSVAEREWLLEQLKNM
ncbi:MAG: hypothetical protein ACK4TA_00380 [Saprospiraceae bacterium]